jgi:hypothetical protein
LVGAILPLFLVISACDSGGSNEEEQNDHEFTLDISPASFETEVKRRAPSEDTLLNGYTFFRNPPPSESPGDRNNFLLYLNENETLEDRQNQEGLLGFASYLDGLPAPGEHPIEGRSTDAYQDGEAFRFLLYYDYQKYTSGDLNGLTYFNCLDGTITFQQASEDWVAGSVDAVAEAVRIVAPDTSTGYDIIRDTVNVSGEFEGKNATSFLPFPQGSPEPY